MPRPRKKGGGVGFLIKKGLVYHVLNELNENNLDPTYEHYYIELKGDQQNIVIGSIYHPPNTNLHTFMSEYRNSLEQLKKIEKQRTSTRNGPQY